MICRMTKQQRITLDEYIAAHSNAATVVTYSIIADHLNGTHDSPKTVLEVTARLAKAKKQFNLLFKNDGDLEDNHIIEVDTGAKDS